MKTVLTELGSTICDIVTFLDPFREPPADYCIAGKKLELETISHRLLWTTDRIGNMHERKMQLLELLDKEGLQLNGSVDCLYSNMPVYSLRRSSTPNWVHELTLVDNFSGVYIGATFPTDSAFYAQGVANYHSQRVRHIIPNPQIYVFYRDAETLCD